MCGIFGFYGSGKRANKAIADRRTQLDRMAAYISHRGPDAIGTYQHGPCAIGTARLKIIDMDGGVQPFSDDQQRYWLAYNGEIYNYLELREELRACGATFKTASDTEVVLKAFTIWGKSCFDRFNGGFGIAIYDSLSGKLVLARDRYGKRPLFITEQAGMFCFASEMKSFLGIDGVNFDWDVENLASIFASWTPIWDQTPFLGIKQIPPGHLATIDKGAVQIARFAELDLGIVEDSNNQSAINIEEAAKEVRSALQNSVKLRLRSDVSVGIYLSGGLDSAIIASLVQDYGVEDMHALSVVFEDQEFSEARDQEAVKNHLGINSSAVSISADSLVDYFEDATWHAEIPQFRTAYVPMYLLSKQANQNGLKVVLSGEGADEVFLGYDIFRETLLRSIWPSLRAVEAEKFLGSIYKFVPHISGGGLGAAKEFFVRNSEGIERSTYSHDLRFRNNNFHLRIIGRQGFDYALLNELIETQFPDRNGSAIQRGQFIEFVTLLQGYLLSTQGDRMSFAHGVETRCPFLDPNVVRIASKLHLHSLISKSFDEKHILKVAFKDRLPEQILDKPKRPYISPDAGFISRAFSTSKWRDWSKELSNGSALQSIPTIDHRFCGRLIEKLSKLSDRQISPRETQAATFLLSLGTLDQQFVSGRRDSTMRCKTPIERFGE
jgi:asparagine synthase (glutamine-hydrolysing)